MATPTYKFSGHESFPCKSLWLKKGYDFVANNYDFNSPDAVMELGVGKNMVSSIRYWLRAFGITNEGCLSEIGKFLFDEETGRDKYLEDIATLWLLHYNIVSNKEATLYNWFFCRLQKERSQFNRDDIMSFVKYQLTEEGKQNLYNENTVKKDCSVLLLNYTLPLKVQSNEDYSTLLVDLDLIRQNAEGKGYFYNVEGKRKVTIEVFMYGLLELKKEKKDNTIPYEDIRDELGLLFCLNDAETIEILKELARKYPDTLSYSDIAGIRQVQFTKSLEPIQVLEAYYDEKI